MKSLSRVTLLSILALLVLVSALPSYAVTPPGLIISDGTNTITIDQGGNVTFSNPCQNCSTLVVSAHPGSVTWIGSMGAFSSVGAIQASGTSKPQLTGAPQTDLSVSATAATAATINFMWSDVGFPESDIVNLALSAGGTITGSGTATYSAYADNTNTPFGEGVLGGTLGPYGPPDFNSGATPVIGPGPTAAPFSMTNSVTFQLGAGSTGGGDFFLQALPSALALSCPTGTGQVNVPYSSSLNGNGGIPPYTYSITSGSLPPGLNLDTSGGGITGTPNQGGTSTFTANITDSDVPQGSASVQCSITIQPPTQLYEISGYTYSDNNVPPNMIYDNPPDTPIGSVTINLAACSAPGTVIASTTTNASGFYQFNSLQAGCYQITAPPTANSESLETAPTLTANIGPNSDNNDFGYIQPGTISGYTYSDNNENQVYDSPDNPIPGVTVTLTDCNGLPVANQPPVVTDNNGYYQFSNLPAGCYKVNAPSTAGGESADTPSTITVNPLSPGGNSQNNNFGYTPPPVSGTCLVINNAEQGVPLQTGPMTGSGGAGGPYTFSSSDLPGGLTMASNGSISGTPNTSGTFTYHVTVTDKDGNHSTIQCSITINPPLSVTCGTTTVGEVGVAFNSGPMTVTGGTAPYTYSIVGTLPAGLSLNTSNGAITGTATASGTFTVKVTDASGATSTSCNITINPPLSVTCGTTTVGEVGIAFNSGPMTVTGGTAPYTYSIVGTLPAGLSLNTSNGAITGTATASGTFTVKVTDASGATSTSCNITINPPLSVTCGTTTVGEVGVAFNSGPMTVTGGTAPYTYSIVGTLPAGLSLNTSNGAITGTATASGTFTVKVTDANGASSTSCQITINPALSVTCGTTTVGEVGVAFNSGPMTVTGGTAPYTYSIVGTLPAGLSLNTSNGAITGTATASGTFTVKVTDANGASSTSCQITINPALSVTCGTTTVGEVGVAFNSGPMTVTGGTAPYTYSIVGTLPAGLSLNTSTGAITGTATASGTFTVKVTDANGASSTSCQITINPALSVTCGTTTVGEVGVAFNSGPMTVTGGTAPYTYSIVGTLPAGLSLNTSTGAITGTATASGTFTVKVTDANGATSTSCNITINPALSVTCGTTTVGEVGVAFNSGPMTVTGGTAPYTYSIVGTLPAGLSLNTSTGAITGTATASGTFTVKVTDANGASSTSCQITINPALSVTCGTTTVGEVGVAFNSGPMTVTGGTAPYTYSIVGTLPAGLSLNTSTGAITGTATASGTFTVKVTDANGASSTSCNITINPALSVTCGTTTVGEVGVAFNSGPMTVTGGTAPYTYSIVGTLPAGLSLNTSNGAITGTATASGTFTVKVTDANGASSTSCQITINPALSVTCGTTTVGEVGVAFNSGPMTVTGGTAPYTYSIVGTLPAGLSLNTSTGAITGTATASGTFTVKVTDANGASSTSCQITINPALSVTCGTTTVGEVGVAFNSGPMTVTGGTAPYTYSIVGTLPAGLSLNTSNGAITGTATASGTFTVKVTDANGASSTSCQITINPALSVTCGTTTVGEVGVAFNSGPMTVTGGTAPYTYSIVGTLPAGLSLNTSNGAITGTATASGTFTVKVTDANGASSTSCQITINPALSVTCGTTTVGEVGVAFNSGPMTVTGGTAPYTYSIVGTLPAGLSLNTSNGAITGTATASGTFTVKVTDANGATSTSCNITINSSVALACASNATGEVGVAFSAQMTASGGVAPYTYAVATGSLPSGLSLNASTGLISGTPTATGTFTIKVTDSLSHTASATCPITIYSVPTSTCAVINATAGVAITPVTMTGSGGSGAPYTFSASGLPAGLSISSSGTISGTPTSSGTFPYTVTVTDSAGDHGTVSCSVTVASALGSVEGTVWNDENANDIQDSGEPGLRNVTVKLETTTGTVITTMVTNSAGFYDFTGLTPGTYMVCVDQSTVPVGFIETYDYDGLSTPNCATGIVPSGQELVMNFGYFKPICESTTSVTSNFNSTSISAGRYIWYTLHLKANGLPAHSIATVRFDNGLVEANINGVPYNLTLPSGIIVYNPNVTTSVLNYDAPSNTFTMTVPTSESGNVFLTGIPYLVPSGGLPGGISNVKVTGRMSTDVAGVGTQWQWAAAVYTQFSTNPTQLGIKPVDDSTTSQYHNSDPAGTPENYKQYVTGGGCGNGGSNYIGNSSSTATTTCQSGCQKQTYTCNGWNASSCNGNPGAILQKNYPVCYPGGSVSIGGCGGYQLTFTNASAVGNFVLQGGSPGCLNQNATNPTSSAAGQFAGDVLALRLNIDYSSAGITAPGFGNMTVTSGWLQGYTVNQVMNLANQVLSGQWWYLPWGMQVSDLDNVVATINSNYENGAIDNGYLH